MNCFQQNHEFPVRMIVQSLRYPLLHPAQGESRFPNSKMMIVCLPVVPPPPKAQHFLFAVLVVLLLCLFVSQSLIFMSDFQKLVRGWQKMELELKTRAILEKTNN